MTVWGTGGIGKTRLAMELASGPWPSACGLGRVILCDLTEAHDEGGVRAEVARALGSASSAPASLALSIASRGPLLLVIDNFEQVARAAPSTVGAWLEAAPEARFLVTSRERLGVPGEVSFELPPLSLVSTADAQPSEAVQLFLDRVRALRPDFEPRGTLVDDVVRALEGIPMAIELAAGRVDVLGVEGLLARLSRRLDVLGADRPGADPRQTTLRGAIQWSWDLLGGVEQRALAQCSVFRGSFTAQAAEGVLELGPGASVLDVIQSLRDKSMLRSGPVMGGGEARLSLFESIREFAAERLAAMGETDEAARRHAAFHRALAERQGGGVGWLTAARLLPERDNLVAAIRWTLDQALALAGDPSPALAYVVAADGVLAACGPLSTHVGLLDAAIGLADRAGSAEPSLLARALSARARALSARAPTEESLRDLERALTLAHDAGADALEGSVLTDLGVLHHQRRDIARARGCYEAALAMHRRTSDRRAEGRVLGDLGALHHDVGEYQAASAHYAQALVIFRAAGDERLEGTFLTNLGVLDQEQGRLDEARSRYEQALRVLERVGDARIAAITRSNLSNLHHERGDADAARAGLAQAAAALREVGDLRSEALCIARLGAACATLGRIDEARAHLDAAEAQLDRLGDPVALGVAQVHRAFLDLAEARRADATGRGAEASAHVARAVAAVERARRPPQPGAASPAELSDDVRAALRLLDPALARVSAQGPGGITFRPDALTVGPGATWYRTPQGSLHDLRQRRSARLILEHLVTHHPAGPGRGAALDALREAAWPGEKMTAAAATNRVQVAIADLRKRGLKSCLVRRDDGYALDPGLAVQEVGAPWEEVAAEGVPLPSEDPPNRD